VPSLGTSAGARLTVRRCWGNWNPALRIDARTRSRASWMVRSVSPTMVKLGNPLATKGLPKRIRVRVALLHSPPFQFAVHQDHGDHNAGRADVRHKIGPQLNVNTASVLAGDPLSQRHATGRRPPHPRRALVRKCDCSSGRPPRSELPALWECSAAIGWCERR
jgi:hypothetical protein